MKNIFLYALLILGIIFFQPNETDAQWNHTGPQGGEVDAFCESGSNLFAAPWSGGIYISTDNGASWTPVNNGLTNINIRVTALYAEGSNIFAGTWGSGVFRSTDMGNTWIDVNDTVTAGTYVHKFLLKGNSLFMGSQGGGICRTTDNGASWEHMNNGLLSLDVRDLALKDTIIFAATWGTYQVFRSTDNGQSWQLANNGIANPASDPRLGVSGNDIFLGTFADGIYRSTDNGNNWVQVNNGLPATATIRAFAVNGSNIFAATRGEGILLSTDNGTNWDSVNTGLTTNWVESLIVNSNQDVFAGTYRNGIFRSTDNGTNWVEENSGYNANTVYAYATFPNGTGGNNLLAGTGSGVFQSNDNGITWNFLGLNFKAVYGLAVVGTDIFAGAMGSGVFRSTDDGATWTASGLANAMIWTMYTDGTDIYAGLGFFGGAYRSTDNGNTWSSVSGLEYKWVMSFTENAQYIFAGAIYGGAFRSSDNGNTFTPINNGLDNRVSILAVMGDSTIFAGTGDPNGQAAAGMYRSNDNGTSWTQINNGLPPTSMIWGLAVKDTNLFASTSSSDGSAANVYLTTDKGNNWSTVDSGLVSNYIQALFIDDTTIFAGTIGSGTWWRPLSEVILPVELTSFTGNIRSDGSVLLNWSTATESNNRGFEIQRSIPNSGTPNSTWTKIGFIAGNGTTTRPETYSFVDKNVSSGNYVYRLKQIDFDGSFKYSKEVEVNVNVPSQFSLSQNYPNPFNPTTTIDYSIQKDGNVSLKVFNTLGQQVAELINGNMKAGQHQVTFDASRFASGIYYYRLESNNKVLIKKMILLK